MKSNKQRMVVSNEELYNKEQLYVFLLCPLHHSKLLNPLIKCLITNVVKSQSSLYNPRFRNKNILKIINTRKINLETLDLNIVSTTLKSTRSI